MGDVIWGQGVVAALRIVGLPLLVALGAFGVYAAAGFDRGLGMRGWRVMGSV